MGATTCRRLIPFPDVRRSAVAKQRFPAGRNQRKTADHGRRMSRRLHEPGVVIVGDGETSDEKLTDMDMVNRTFVFFRVGGSHQKVAA